MTADTTVVGAIVLYADMVRLRRHLDGQTQTDYLRGLISDDLEAAGKPPLREVAGLRRRGRTPKPVTHGTYYAFQWHGCRCQLCVTFMRAKRHEYYVKRYQQRTSTRLH